MDDVFKAAARAPLSRSALPSATPAPRGESATRAAAPLIAVRRAVPADAAALAPLLGALGYPAEAAAVAGRLETLLGSPRDAVLVAEEGGAALGVLALHWGVLLHLPEPIARIGSLVVAEDARGRGVGALLVRDAAVLARAEGCATLELTTGRQRHAAHAFYEALGFVWTARRYALTLGRDGVQQR